MAHADFRIGILFSSGGHIWLCTDVGARTVIALQLAQRLGIEAESAILVALASYLRELDNREMRPQRLARAQALARAVGVAPCPSDDKVLMDDMWGKS